MKIIRWRPFPMNFDRWPDDATVGPVFEADTFTPSLDVYQTKEAVVVETPLAGVDPNQVNISVENDVLTIEGSMEKKSEVEEKNYIRKEIRTGSFHRAVALPTAVQGEKAEAVFENGMLKVTIPKEERAKPTTVRVQVQNSKK